MIDFQNIEYLKTGNSRQQNAYSILNDLRIFECLKEYSPILTGTIPIGIDLPDSDLDIICECKDHTVFETYLKNNFSKYCNFQIWTNIHHGVKSTIASFSIDGQMIEIFGQNISTDKQNAYRHMLVENQILQDKGVEFKKQIIELKMQGMKTEPAFAKILGLVGNSYLELLKLDTDLIIREIKPEEYDFLKEMLYQAIFVPDENTILPREIIEQPELKRYIEYFGQNEDFCLVAERKEKLMGAIWIRLINGYGFVDSETPELSMAVLREYRGKGIGKQLIETMINHLKNGKFKQVSLSVDKKNFAYQLYKKFEFVDYVASEKSIAMTKQLID